MTRATCATWLRRPGETELRARIVVAVAAYENVARRRGDVGEALGHLRRAQAAIQQLIALLADGDERRRAADGAI